MTIQVSTTDARTARALELLATADRWLKITSKTDGRRYYVVPGSNGRVYWARPDACSCPDATHRGATCKHMVATALYVAKVNAERQPKRKASKRAPSFTRDASIGGTIAAPERARLVALADSIWGVDGE
jgi:uncharacterized Zn finger protein